MGWEGLYEVSSHGRVRRLPVRVIRADGREVTSQSGIRKAQPNNSGHLILRLTRPGTPGVMKQVHRLVCEAFHGPAPEGKNLVLHWDDDPLNNTPENLRWGDLSDNQRDAVRNGRHSNTRKTHCKNGHELSGDNLRLTTGGLRRECRKCGNQIRREWKSAQNPSDLNGPEDSRHGNTGYRVYKCRCETCTEAARNAARKGNRSRELRGLPTGDPRHGTQTGYKTWRCRCDECRRSNREYESRRRERNGKS